MLNHTRIGTRCGTIIILFFLFFFFDSPIFPLRSNFTIHRCSSTNDTKSYTRLKWFFFFAIKSGKTQNRRNIYRKKWKREKKKKLIENILHAVHMVVVVICSFSLSLSLRDEILFDLAAHSIQESLTNNIINRNHYTTGDIMVFTVYALKYNMKWTTTTEINKQNERRLILYIINVCNYFAMNAFSLILSARVQKKKTLLL